MVEREAGGRITKGQETLGAEGHVLYFGRGDFTSIFHTSKGI